MCDVASRAVVAAALAISIGCVSVQTQPVEDVHSILGAWDVVEGGRSLQGVYRIQFLLEPSDLSELRIVYRTPAPVGATLFFNFEAGRLVPVEVALFEGVGMTLGRDGERLVLDYEGGDQLILEPAAERGPTTAEAP